MTFTFYIIFSLVGAAILGFLSAWFWQKHHIDESKGSNDELSENLQTVQTNSARLKSENDTQLLSINNLQKLMQGIEAQSFKLEQELKKSEQDNENLRDEKHRLMAEVELLMKEYEAIREMPAIDLNIDDIDDEEGEIDIRTKAKKLVRAFKKGFGPSSTPPTAS